MRMPHRGPLRHMAQDQANFNSRLAGERAVVESAFAAIKSYRALGGVFRGSAADLERTLTIATGIVNLKRMLGRDKGGGAWMPTQEARAVPQAAQGARKAGRGILCRRRCVPTGRWPALAPSLGPSPRRPIGAASGRRAALPPPLSAAACRRACTVRGRRVARVGRHR